MNHDSSISRLALCALASLSLHVAAGGVVLAARWSAAGGSATPPSAQATHAGDEASRRALADDLATPKPHDELVTPTRSEPPKPAELSPRQFTRPDRPAATPKPVLESPKPEPVEAREKSKPPQPKPATKAEAMAAAAASRGTASKQAVDEPAPRERQVKLGSDKGLPVATVAWIGYEDFQTLMARRGKTEQPALQMAANPVPVGPIEFDATEAMPIGPDDGFGGKRGRGVDAPAPPSTPAVTPPAPSRQPAAPAAPPPAPPMSALVPSTPPASATPTPPPAARAVATPPAPIAPSAATSIPPPPPASPSPSPKPAVQPAMPGRLPVDATPTPDGKIAAPSVEPAAPAAPPAASPTSAPPAAPPALPSASPTSPERPAELAMITAPPAEPLLTPAASAPPPAAATPPGHSPPTPAAAPSPNGPPSSSNAAAAPAPSPTPGGGAGATPRVTAAPRSDRESPPVSLSDGAKVMRPGSVLVGEGIEIKTAVPRIDPIAQVSTIPSNPLVRVVFDPKGTVREAVMVRGTGSPNWDGPILASLYRWRAAGKKLAEHNGPVVLEITILIID